MAAAENALHQHQGYTSPPANLERPKSLPWNMLVFVRYEDLEVIWVGSPNVMNVAMDRTFIPTYFLAYCENFSSVLGDTGGGFS